MAATGVGVGDLVAALVAGTLYGNVFVWAIVMGALLKYILNEGIGRWYLATGQTILQGWHSLGKWATGYFGIYLVILGFAFGAAVTSATALATTTMFPALPLWSWAVIHSLAGFLLVWSGHYRLFEQVMIVLVGVMFVTEVGSAAILFPNLAELSLGLVPRLPDGSLFYALGLIGGIGATVTLAAYGYWLREKGWKGSSWIPMMRLDLTVAYTMTGLFTLSLLVVGMELLFGTGIILEGDKGMVELTRIVGKELGEAVRWLFLIGFWSASFTSLWGRGTGSPTSSPTLSAF
ncbi:Nramp family divalent metal transporter [Marinithermofilum abyssi]|nr:Nramp family divalent metal transporter [Marinithermofilum abyssi]